jgi:integrase/recombinase XerD
MLSQSQVSASASTSSKTAKSALLERKIDETAAGLQASVPRQLHSISETNAVTIVEYVAALKSEVNFADNYRRDVIIVLCRFSMYHNNRAFKDLTRTDVLDFLDSHRKNETQDPLHKWIGTYNTYRMLLLRFFKWLYSPDIEPTKRQKPPVMENIPKLRRKEKSIYKPSDLWTQQDDLLFLKYCPSARERCYHAISRDLSARPHEILKLKIKDLSFKSVGSSQYCEVVVNGKTGQRSIPLINSIPYLKDYLDHAHPQPRNPNAPLICGVGRGLGRHLHAIRILVIYDEYKKHIFPKLLESPSVLPEDKHRIQELLKKPWNPYIRRHSALTEKSTILKEHVLRQHAGWSGRSQMHLKYLHYFGNESNESLLEAYGIVAGGQQIDQLRPKQCPNCSEPNKIDSKFCASCRMVLSYDAFEETLEEQKKKESEVQAMKVKHEEDMKSMRDEMDKKFEMLMSAIQQNPQLAQVKPEALTKKLEK